MVKTQIQIPDRLYRKAKAIAAAREISFAEVVRRGMEYVTTVYGEAEPEKKGRRLPVLPKENFAEGIDRINLKEVLEQEDARL